METITIYHDPSQNITHILRCEVNDESGEHKVLHSKLLHLVDLKHTVAFAQHVYGANNVRAFFVKEILY